MKVLICLLFLVGCNYSSDYQTNDFKGNIYYSLQSGNTLYCSVYYHFKKDSLIVYNSATKQILKFKIKYLTNDILLENDEIQDYRLNFAKSDDEIINLYDKSRFLNMDDVIKLKKIELKDTLLNNKDTLLNNIYGQIWGANINDTLNKIIDSIWFNFKENKSLDSYTKLNMKEDISYSKSTYEFINVSDKLNIIEIKGQTISFLLLKSAKDNLIFFISRCDQDDGHYISFHPIINEDKKEFFGEWIKTDSFNEFELPYKLKINKYFISIDEENLRYSLGLKGKFIHIENGNYYNVLGIANDTLSISITNSVKEREIATYKRNSHH